MNPAFLAKEKLIGRAAIILLRRLSRNEEFKQLTEQYRDNQLPAEAQELLERRIETLIRQVELRGGEEERALLDLVFSDTGVPTENRLQDYVNANMSEELREILSQMETMLQSDADMLSDSLFTPFTWELEEDASAEKIIDETQRYMERLQEAERSFREGLDELNELEQITNQLRMLEAAADTSSEGEGPSDAATDNPIINEVVDSIPSSDAATDNPVIREIVDTVSDGITVQEVREIVDKIKVNNLNPADVIRALDNVITEGPPLTPSDSFSPQSLPIDCVQTLSSAILGQFGVHVPPGVITLRALLDGSLPAPKLLYGKCIDLLITKYCPYIPTDAAGTWNLQLTKIFERVNIPVDINYDASLIEIQEALAQGKRVMVGLEVSPIWSGQEGGHVVQVLEVDVDKGTVTVLDTGSLNMLGRPDGNRKEYDLEAFEEARELGGRIVISTKEAPPSTVSEEAAAVDNVESTARTPEADVALTVVAGGQVIEADGELIALLSESAPSDDELDPAETGSAEGSDLSAGSGNPDTSLGVILGSEFDNGYIGVNNGNPDTSLGVILGSEFDNGYTTKDTTEEARLFTSEDQVVDYATINNGNSSPPVLPVTDGGVDCAEANASGA